MSLRRNACNVFAPSSTLNHTYSSRAMLHVASYIIHITPMAIARIPAGRFSRYTSWPIM